MLMYGRGRTVYKDYETIKSRATRSILMVVIKGSAPVVPCGTA